MNLINNCWNLVIVRCLQINLALNIRLNTETLLAILSSNRFLWLYWMLSFEFDSLTLIVINILLLWLNNRIFVKNCGLFMHLIERFVGLIFWIIITEVGILYILRISLHVTVLSQVILIWIVIIFILEIQCAIRIINIMVGAQIEILTQTRLLTSFLCTLCWRRGHSSCLLIILFFWQYDSWWVTTNFGLWPFLLKILSTTFMHNFLISILNWQEICFYRGLDTCSIKDRILSALIGPLVFQDHSHLIVRINEWFSWVFSNFFKIIQILNADLIFVDGRVWCWCIFSF